MSLYSAMIDYASIFRSFMRGRMHPLYEVMYSGLLRYAAQMLGDDLSYLAEDCVQDAVMTTYMNRERLEDADHWRRYMMLCIHNRALKVVRHQHVHDTYVGNSDMASEQDVSHALIRQEMLDTLYAAIESLPDIYRDVFDLSFEQGLKNAEIAHLLDIAEITVKKRKERLLNMLRAKLGGISEMELVMLLLYAGILSDVS